jgi:hypothetical protein
MRSGNGGMKVNEFSCGPIPKNDQSASRVIKIVKCIQTCKAFPSQWDLFSDDGKKIYVRYRRRFFYAHHTDVDEDESEYLDIDCEMKPDEDSGVMSTEFMCFLTSNYLDFSDCTFEEGFFISCMDYKKGSTTYNSHDELGNRIEGQPMSCEDALSEILKNILEEN